MSNPEIPVKSPLALIGVFLSILRERFSPGNGLTWTYSEGEDARLTNPISIEAGRNEHTEEKNKRPAIYVLRGPVGFKQAGIGDYNAIQMKSGARVYYATAETSFNFVVESNEEGEAAQIADIVLSTVMMGSDLIERAFAFRKLGPFGISAASRPVYDNDVSQIVISMGLTYDVRWGTIPISPLLNEIVVKSRNSNYNSNDEYFTEIYKRSIRWHE